MGAQNATGNAYDSEKKKRSNAGFRVCVRHRRFFLYILLVNKNMSAPNMKTSVRCLLHSFPLSRIIRESARAKTHTVTRSVCEKLLCQVCGGKGYFVNANRKRMLCSSCMGMGTRGYTYF